MDNLLILLAVGGVTYVIGVPGGDDIMLNYQSTSYHDVLAVRQILNFQPAPEFAEWLMSMGLMNEAGLVRPDALPAQLFPLLART